MTDDRSDKKVCSERCVHKCGVPEGADVFTAALEMQGWFRKGVACGEGS